MSNNYSKSNIELISNPAEKGRVMLAEILGLTGCEISVNNTPAGEYVPFVHSHKMNEEVYIILSGTGKFMVDDEEFAIKKGDVVRVSPAGKRAIKAETENLQYICIQIQENSLTQSTHADGVIEKIKASWM